MRRVDEESFGVEFLVFLQIPVELFEPIGFFSLDFGFGASHTRHFVFFGSGSEGGDFGRWENRRPNKDNQFIPHCVVA